MKPEAVFHLGDFVTESPDDWLIFRQITAELRNSAEFYPVVGNHEYKAGIESFWENFTLPNNRPWYSLERHGVHFIVLDTNGSFAPEAEQYKWLESDLQDISKTSKFTIVLFHHAPFNSRRPDEMDLKHTLVPILEKYKVDVVFNGHVHAYEKLRRNNINYIITGGGGAPLHDKISESPYSQKYLPVHHFCLLSIHPYYLSVKVLDSDLKLIDQFNIKSKK